MSSNEIRDLSLGMWHYHRYRRVCIGCKHPTNDCFPCDRCTREICDYCVMVQFNVDKKVRTHCNICSRAYTKLPLSKRK
jgi:hypothetical protein